jgi:hypothetical protein
MLVAAVLVAVPQQVKILLAYYQIVLLGLVIPQAQRRRREAMAVLRILRWRIGHKMAEAAEAQARLARAELHLQQAALAALARPRLSLVRL